MKYDKIVVIPCQLDGEGKVVIGDNLEPPYGYHHVLAVYGDNSYWKIADIDSSISEEKLQEITRIIADSKPIEFDPEFYNKIHAAS